MVFLTGIFYHNMYAKINKIMKIVEYGMLQAIV